MSQPEPPASLPRYLAEGIPKQNVETLHDVREYVDALIEYREEPVDADELPDAVEPVDRDDDEMGTIVKEKVKCGDETYNCASENLSDMYGPYLYRYYREGGKLTSEYLGKP
ncbi:hypothetical protein EXE41_16360 [Halorubrum sp. SD690R]|uniref:hypothetical protein n=1 Tax=Halorubrum sp. SD690R TaxID=2518117 RepID=UPI0010F7B8FC|nr:hypothetical protein [Halorubrum sp. SD690R]TKX42927.1 hypothetical protein EXE41_16360 [Halorubrum sp. SD690R]